MKPIGLTTKKDGELMIIHLCLNCGKISCNRIAGDDNAYVIVKLLDEEPQQEIALTVKQRNLNVSFLNQKDKPLVLTAMYGFGYEKNLK